MHLAYADGRFDTVIAANVIHLLDEPLKAKLEPISSGSSLFHPTNNFLPRLIITM